MMPNTPVVITGLGPISAIGCGREEFWSSLVAGRHGFGPITLCDVSRSPSKVGAEVKGFRLERYIEHGRVIARRTPRSIQFALAASTLALQDASINLDDQDKERIGVYIGTSIANMAEGFSLRDKWLATGTVAPHTAFHTFNHAAACILSSLFDIRGPIHTTSSGCNSGLDALGQSMRLIQLGVVDTMLVVGTDCELVPEILAALNASGSLSTRYNDDPGRASRPFDLGRDGNVIGEGAAALLLESEPHARARGAKIYAQIAGYSMCSAGRHRKYSHDAPDIDLDPCVRSFRNAMSEAGWNPANVGLVYANGSSSVLYDRIEAMALAEVFGETFPSVRVYSSKSVLGQHGAGSSALQLVGACLSIESGITPPTINHEEPDPACGPLRVVTRADSFGPKKVLVHSIGLGGFYYSCGALTAANGKAAAPPGQ
ncbi:MAG TPA: beta-ketoacyl-[acyl-carrier-protein] synthase family protein [Pyrinomonadaceae bacterium]|jgi:3-oxoacyl-[acyl-carrier-protein] synthase II